MRIIYSGEKSDNNSGKIIFLAGPTPRSNKVESWRPDVIELLENINFTGTIIIPEPRNGQWDIDYDHNYHWEREYLDKADCILCWGPRELKDMPAFTTNVEFGRYVPSQKLFFGTPDEAERIRYLEIMYKHETRRKRRFTLSKLVYECTQFLEQNTKEKEIVKFKKKLFII